MRLLFAALVLCACAGPVPPRLPEIEQAIFAPNCTFSSCHSVAGHAGNLVLTPGRAFASLVQHACEQKSAAADGYLRVVPGDLARSFLVLKLSAHLDPRYGERMPRQSSKLPDPDLAAIQEWIRLGATAD